MELLLKAVEKTAQETDNPEEFLKIADPCKRESMNASSKPVLTQIAKHQTCNSTFYITTLSFASYKT